MKLVFNLNLWRCILKRGIVAFAFGVPYNNRSNRLISTIASEKARELKAPVYTQLDVRIRPEIEVNRADEEIGNPPPTLRIARGAVEWARNNKLDELWVVAAEPHKGRCTRDLKFAVREAKTDVKVWVCIETRWYPKEIWFDPRSTQPRTQSARNWWPREWILRAMPMFVYKRVAS